MLRFLWVKMSVSLPFQWFQIEFKKSVFVCSRIPRGFAMVRILLCIIQLYKLLYRKRTKQGQIFHDISTVENRFE